MHFQTARLEIREFMLDDIRPYYKLMSIPSVCRYEWHAERTMEESKTLVQENIDAQTVKPRKCYELAVDYEGKFIGRIGAFMDRKKKVASVWYCFMPAVQGKGFATEAMEAFLPLLGDGLTFEIECDPRNEPSWKLGLRLGFKKTETKEKVEFCKGEWVDSLTMLKVIPKTSAGKKATIAKKVSVEKMAPIEETDSQSE